jgi:hypothetical protein
MEGKNARHQCQFLRVEMNYRLASNLANAIAKEMDGGEPIIVAWHGAKLSGFSLLRRKRRDEDAGIFVPGE